MATDQEALRAKFNQLDQRQSRLDLLHGDPSAAYRERGRTLIDAAAGDITAELQAPSETVRTALADFDAESAQQAEFREELERCAAQAERLRAGVLAAAQERTRLNAGIAKFEAA